MAGVDARRGFVFQDSILADRLLEYQVSARKSEIEGHEIPPSPRFGVEAPAHNGADSEWDILVISVDSGEQETVLEEVKGGEVKREDRHALWRRIRRSFQAGRRCRVALTIDAENPPSQVGHWRGLRAAVPGAKVLSQVPAQVRSATDLGEEALYILVAEGTAKSGANALSEDVARALLSTFELREVGRGTVATRIAERLAVLQYGLAVDEVRQSLAGRIGELAASSVASDRFFTVNEIIEKLDVLKRLASVNPEHARIWRDLRAASDAHFASSPDFGPKGLPYQDWRVLQPSVAVELDRPGNKSLAVLGRGGLGKSVVLDRWARERVGATCLWIHASLLSVTHEAGLSAALDLGAFCSTSSGTPLTVCIDALDGASLNQTNLFTQIATAAALPQIQVVLTCRASTWASLRDPGEALPGWTTASVEPWSSAVVTAMISKSGRPQCSADLVDVLRTPLLLDIFLRTFGPTATIPPGVQSRHGVLASYWQRRILGDGAAAIEKRVFLSGVAVAEASGKKQHLQPSEYLQGMISEGLFVSESGRYRFRHPLLRDFCMMEWALEDAPGEADRARAAVRRLENVSDSLARVGAWRQVLEAVSNPGPTTAAAPANNLSLHDLAQAVAGDQKVVLRLAEILGEFDDPKSLSIDVIGSALGVAGFGARLVKFAIESSNFAWLDQIAVLPEGAQWSESSVWVDDAFLVEVAMLLEAALARNAVGGETKKAVARRVRNWSRAPRFANDLARSIGGGWSLLIPTVGSHAPSRQTLEWLREVAPISRRTREVVLEVLPGVVKIATEASVQLECDPLIETYVIAAGLEWKEGALCDSPQAEYNSMSDFYRIETALIGPSQGAPGLLQARPECFLGVAFAMLAGQHRTEEVRRNELWATVREKATSGTTPEAAPPLQELQGVTANAGPSDGPEGEEPKDGNSPTIRELLAKLDRLYPEKITIEEALGGLENDIRHDEYWEGDQAWMLILQYLSSTIGDALQKKWEFIQGLYWPAVQTSVSAVARVQLLDELCRAANEKISDDIVDQLLTDRRLYHCAHSEFFLWQGIKRRWSEAAAPVKESIMSNIRSVGASPTKNGSYAVGQLLDAIPTEDRPAELLPYVEVFQLLGVSPTPSDPRVVEEAPRVSDADPSESYERNLKIPGVSATCEGLWRDLAQWPIAKLKSETSQNVDSGIECYRRVLNACLPAPASIEKAPWVLRRWKGFLEYLSDGATGRASALSADELRKVVDWAFSVARSQSAEKVNGDQSSLKVAQGFSVDEGHIWCEAIGLLDEGLAHSALASDQGLRTQLLSEVERILPGIAPNTARRVFTDLRQGHWIRDDAGKRILLGLLKRPLMDPGALSWGMHHLHVLTAQECQGVLRWWVEGEDALPKTEAGFDLAMVMGNYLGARALGRDAAGEYSWHRPMCETYLATRPLVGVLATDRGYRRWVAGVAAGAKEAAVSEDRRGGDAVPSDYAALISACWRRLLEVPRGADEKQIHFALHGFFSIADSTRKQPPKKPAFSNPKRWWTALEPLACDIIRRGPSDEVCSLILSLAMHLPEVLAVFGTESLRGVVGAIRDRSNAGPPDQLPPLPDDGHTTYHFCHYGGRLLQQFALALPSPDPMVSDIYSVLDLWPATVQGVLEAKWAVRVHGSLE